ncbi:MAG: glycine cleavage system H protein [Paracoccaceae bacterium]
MKYIRYKHSRFSARFPESFRYSRSHYWMAPGADGEWRVGFTKFATRMLGELVEANFHIPIGDSVESGQEIGTVEGFKAASDVYCAMEGDFAGGNVALSEDACIIRTSPYVDGWLYAVCGEPEAESLDVHGYIAHLDAIIHRMHAEEKANE